jgi:NADPH2:quinone reductase
LDAKERESAISGINDALKSGTLINRLARPTFSLAQTAAAHEAVENGSIGNVVLAF